MHEKCITSTAVLECFATRIKNIYITKSSEKISALSHESSRTSFNGPKLFFPTVKREEAPVVKIAWAKRGIAKVRAWPVPWDPLSALNFAGEMTAHPGSDRSHQRTAWGIHRGPVPFALQPTRDHQRCGHPHAVWNRRSLRRWPYPWRTSCPTSVSRGVAGIFNTHQEEPLGSNGRLSVECSPSLYTWHKSLSN